MTGLNTRKKKSWKKNLFSISASTRGSTLLINEPEKNFSNSHLNRTKSFGSLISAHKTSTKDRSVDGNVADNVISTNNSAALANNYIALSQQNVTRFNGSTRNVSGKSILDTQSSSRQGLTPEEAAMITPRNASRRLNNTSDNNASKRKSLFGLPSIFDPFTISSSSYSTIERKKDVNLDNCNNDGVSNEKNNIIKITKTDSEPSKNSENDTMKIKKDLQKKKLSVLPSKSPIIETFVSSSTKAHKSKSNLSSPISPSFDSFFNRKNNKKVNNNKSSAANDNLALESHQRLLQNFLNDDSLIVDDNHSDSNSIPSHNNNGNQERIVYDELINKENLQVDEDKDRFVDSQDYNFNSSDESKFTHVNEKTEEQIADTGKAFGDDTTFVNSSDNDDKKIANSKTSNFIVDHFKNINTISSSKNKGKSKATLLSSLDTSTGELSLDNNVSANPMSSNSLKSPSYRDRHREIFNRNIDQQSISASTSTSRCVKLSPVGSNTSPASSQYFSSKMLSPISSTATPHSNIPHNKRTENSRSNKISNLLPNKSDSHFDFSDDDEVHELTKKDSTRTSENAKNDEHTTSSALDGSDLDTNFNGTITSLLDDMTRIAASTSLNNDVSHISTVSDHIPNDSEALASTLQTLDNVVGTSQSTNLDSVNNHNINSSQARISTTSSAIINHGRRQNRNNADEHDDEGGHPVIEDHHSRMNLLNPFRRHRFNIRSTRSAQNHQQFQYHLDNYDIENENHSNLPGRSDQDHNNAAAMPMVLQYQSEMLSRLLITASQSTLRNLIGSSYDPNDGARIDNRNRNRDLSTFHSNNGSFEDGLDMNFAEFCHALRHGNLIANELSNSARNEIASSDSDSNSMSFFRAFRFPPRIMNEDADGNPIPVTSNSINNNSNNLLHSNVFNEDNGDQEEMIPVLILGVRSVMPGEVNQVRQAADPNISISTNNSQLGSSETARNESSSSDPSVATGTNGSSVRNQDEAADIDENHGRFGRLFFRNRTHRSRFRLENSRNNNRLEELAQHYSRSRYSRSAQGGHDGNSYTFSESSGNGSLIASSNLNNDSSNTSGASLSSRNLSNNPNRNERSWVIFMMGHNFPLDHPVLTAPTLLSENPSYEDLLALQAMLGEVKAPVATAEEVEAGGGLVHFVVSGEKFPIDEEDQVYPDTDIVDATDRCLVCLTEFETGEVGRKLKACGHVYHKDCIDRWLTTGRNSCPLCRKKGVPTLKKKSSSASPTDQAASNFDSEDNVLNDSEISNANRSTINERHESIGTIDIIGGGTAPLNFSDDLENHFNL